MIYFDNAATTSPKPEQVIKAVNEALRTNSSNPGRAGHSMAYQTAEKIYQTRKELADFFGIEKEENVIFTHNCTYAINCVIKGLAKPGGHFICSSLEHNAVIRPLETLKERGVCNYSIAKVGLSDDETVENFENLISDDTIAIICTGASNVFGKKLPVKGLSELAHRYGLIFALDAAQTAGITKIDCGKDGIDFLCVAAHKGLYAPMPTGLLIINCDKQLETITEGGTGNLSAVLSQPDGLPERLESGTINVPGIAGTKAGLEFVKKIGVNEIYKHEESIIENIYSGLSEINDIVLYTNPFSEFESFSPLLSFNIKNLNSEEVAAALSEDNIAVRAGYHCAITAHRAYNTESTGTVRIAPSVFTENKDVKLLLNSVLKIAKSK